MRGIINNQRGNASRDIQWPIGRSNIACRNQYNINKRPHAEAAKAEQLAGSFTPETKIETIGTKSTKRHAEQNTESSQPQLL